MKKQASQEVAGARVVQGPSIRWWTAMTVLIIAAIFASSLSPYMRREWALSLTRQPNPYTTLSFSHASDLPSVVRPRQDIDVSFRIANHEGRAVSYRYLIQSIAKGRSVALKQSERALNSGAVWTVDAVVRPRCLAFLCRVVVTLPGHPETIDFMFRAG